MLPTVLVVLLGCTCLRTSLAELKVGIKINATVKCEAHKSCDNRMVILTTWSPKGPWMPDQGLQNDMFGNETTLKVHWDDGLSGGDSYYLRIVHPCPCSNVTAGNPCKARMANLCIDLEDKLKGLPPTGGWLVFDLGEVDLSAPWKYYACPEYDDGLNAPCNP